MREASSVEKPGNEALEDAGWLHVKVGREGWPDTLAMKGPYYLWIEWKAPGGRLTAAQRRRIRNLRRTGAPVAVIDCWKKVAVAAFAVENGSWIVNTMFTLTEVGR